MMAQAQLAIRDLASSADVARRSAELGKSITPSGVRAAALRGDLPVAAVVGKGQRLFRWEDVESFLAKRSAA